ncbi:MAG: acyl-CoA thioesterase II [Geodermatophilaceae bacterium]
MSTGGQPKSSAVEDGSPLGAITGQQAVDSMVAVLDLTAVGEDVFEGTSPDLSLQRVFGGQVAGQALVAAVRTVPGDRPVNSLHAYFLRPGDPQLPIRYEVDRIRDGYSFTTRRVVAKQVRKNGSQEAIFQLSASFQRPETPFIEHSLPMPQGPGPEELADFGELIAPVADLIGQFARIPRPIDRRYRSSPWEPDRVAESESVEGYVWMRADGRLPDDPAIHVCVLTYASDISLLEAGARRAGISFADPDVMPASLDHAMWFHRPFRADEWFLYSSESPSASGGRALCTGQIWSQDGSHIATVVQEGLIRRRRSG